MLDQLLSDREVEKITGRARSTLQKDRLAGRSIPFVRFGRLVRYRQSDVNAFLASLPSCRSASENDLGPAQPKVPADRSSPGRP
jgi:predicted DNA-binding transcriptional regulator AlpA